MPRLVNYSSDDNFHVGGSLCTNPVEFGKLCSMGPCVDIFYPPHKRARVCAPFPGSGFEFEQEKQPFIEQLPDECLFEIFRRLPGGRERSSCACVSKRWLFLMSSMRKAEICKTKSVTNDGSSKPEKEITVSISDNDDMVLCDDDSEIEGDGYLTRSLERKKATDLRLAAIAVGTSSRGGLGKLSIRGSNPLRGVTNSGLSAIARGCTYLRSLSLWDIPTIGDEGLTEIAKECNLLEKLDLCDCPLVSNKGLIAIAENCPNLTALNIESCYGIGNEGLEAIGRSCRGLKSISIKGCPLVGDRGVASLVSSASSVLNKVKLQGLNITDFSLAVIGHYGQAVSCLVLGDLKNVSERGFWVMGNAQGLQKLSTLSLTSCPGITDVSLEAVGNGCKNLKQMCLRKCCFISDAGLSAFAGSSCSLECLQLEELHRVSQAGVVGLLLNCGAKLRSLALVKCMGIKDLTDGVPVLSSSTSLRVLSIRNCPGFGSASLAMVGRLCPNLQHLDLTGLYGITDAGLLPLLENCEAGLVKVNLTGCFNLTDEAVLALVKMHGGTLELLNLDGCRKVTDASLIAIADNCLLLNDLEMSKCAVSDSGVAALSSAEQLNLQVLSLSGCSNISNKCIPSLKRLAGTMLGLNLQRCHSISSSSIEQLVQTLWRCDILS